MSAQPFDGHVAELKKPSPWLASEDLLGRGDVPVVIDRCFRHSNVAFEDGRKETVYALSFVGKKKQLILNATNRKRLTLMFGPHVKDWSGQEVVLYIEQTRAVGGGKTNGIRIRLDDRRWSGVSSSAAEAGASEPTEMTQTEMVLDPFEDDGPGPGVLI